MSLEVPNRQINPTEFYRTQLQANKVEAVPEDLAKFAEARKLPIHTVKLAKLYFEQMSLDGVKYKTDEEQAEDSIKLAVAYFEEAESRAKTAAAVADKALLKLSEAAEALIKAEELTGVR